MLAQQTSTEYPSLPATVILKVACLAAILYDNVHDFCTKVGMAKTFSVQPRILWQCTSKVRCSAVPSTIVQVFKWLKHPLSED